MPDTPCLYARLAGDILEIVTDRLTMREADGGLVAIEDHVRALFASREIRVMTVEEAPWVLAAHVIAPPLAKAA